MGKHLTLAQLRRECTPPLTQRELARKLNVAPSTVANWEIGRRVPNLYMAKTIARLFGIAVEEIAFKPGTEDTALDRAVGDDA